MIRSVRIRESGGPEVLRIEHVEVEQRGEGGVGIRIRAIGISRTQITRRAGRLPAKSPLPTKIGFEAAGEIKAIGPNADGVAIEIVEAHRFVEAGRRIGKIVLTV